MRGAARAGRFGRCWHLIATNPARGRTAAITTLAVVAALAGASSLAPSSALAAVGDHFNCRASAIRVEALPSLKTADGEPVVANALSDPCKAQHSAAANGPAALASVVNTTTGALSATTGSSFASSSAQADVENVDALESSIGLTVGSASATAGYVCEDGSPVPQSSSDVADLSIGGGAPITTSGPVSLPAGGIADVELNETIDAATSVTQRAVDIKVLGGAFGGAEIILGEAAAGLSGNPCQTGTSGLGKPSITGAPSDATNSHSAKLTYKSTDTGAGLQCSADGAVYATCHGKTLLGRLHDGRHTFAVRETRDGVVGGPATVAWTVTDVPAPVNVSPPVLSGGNQSGDTLTCSQGAWKHHPTSFSYSWSRNGTPIQGADSPTYVLSTADEGQTITCTVTASRLTKSGTGTSSGTSVGSGAGAASTDVKLGTSKSSAPVNVYLPRVKGCPAAAGGLRSRRLGPVRLGMTRKQAKQAFPRSSTHNKRYEQFFCFTPIGVRVGYASPKLLRTLPASERRGLRGHVIWASTSNAHYAFNGVRVGSTLSSARRRLGGGNLFHVGLNHWFFAREGSITLVLKVRRGTVRELGIANHSLTRGRRAQRRFIRSFS